jgi:hypothetical protein
MAHSGRKKDKKNDQPFASGAFAILGIDVVRFSTYSQSEQIQIIGELTRFIQEALSGRSLKEQDYSWSSAGDGGYITFLNPSAGDVPLDVAFAIFEKVRGTAGRESLRKGFLIRAGLHAGTVQEGLELAGKKNIFGVGINETARILSIADDSQLLVSREYHDLFAKHIQQSEYGFGQPFQRTVKHGVTLQVMNANKRELGLLQEAAESNRWNCIGTLWHKVASDYETFISDALWCHDPVAAIAASCFLLKLGEEKKVREMCDKISHSGKSSECTRAPKHSYLSHLPPTLLLEVIRNMKPRMFAAGEAVCHQGDLASSCFFVASGQVVVKIPGGGRVPIKAADIVGEFSLWIPGLRRTATVEAEQYSLLLELAHEDFTKILTRNPDIAGSVYSVTKSRVIQNVFNSRSIFPGPRTPNRDDIENGAVCEMHGTGSVLNLDDHCYVLFFGRVVITVAETTRLEISAEGRFDQLPVVGIKSQIGNPDGARAEVLDDTFAVRIDQTDVQKLKLASADIDIAWSALCGRRLHEAGVSLPKRFSEVPPRHRSA